MRTRTTISSEAPAPTRSGTRRCCPRINRHSSSIRRCCRPRKRPRWTTCTLTRRCCPPRTTACSRRTCTRPCCPLMTTVTCNSPTMGCMPTRPNITTRICIRSEFRCRLPPPLSSLPAIVFRPEVSPSLSCMYSWPISVFDLRF